MDNETETEKNQVGFSSVFAFGVMGRPIITKTTEASGKAIFTCRYNAGLHFKQDWNRFEIDLQSYAVRLTGFARVEKRGQLPALDEVNGYAFPPDGEAGSSFYRALAHFTKQKKNARLHEIALEGVAKAPAEDKGPIELGPIEIAQESAEAFIAGFGLTCSPVISDMARDGDMVRFTARPHWRVDRDIITIEEFEINLAARQVRRAACTRVERGTDERPLRESYLGGWVDFATQDARDFFVTLYYHTTAKKYKMLHDIAAPFVSNR